MKLIHVGIIGAGQGGTSLLKVLQKVSSVKITGICEIDDNAIGLIEAKKQKIPVYKDLDEMINNETIDMLINVADTSVTRRFILTRNIKDMYIIDGEVAELGWNMITDLFTSINSKEFTCSDKEKKHIFAVTTWEIIKNLAYSSHKIQKEMNDLSFFDPLTRLFSRNMLNEFIKYQVISALRNKKPLSVIMIDIDNFKQINDTWGHSEGDEILIKLSTLLKDYSRKSDLIARFGGEEFIIILPDTHKLDAAHIAEKFRSSIVQKLTTPDNKAITVSFGVTDIINYAIDEDREINKIIHELIKTSDKALYQSKQNGKDMVTVL